MWISRRSRGITMQWIDFSQSAHQREKQTVLDNEQIKTKNLAIPGHALIRGVAGSGKSVVLRDRINQIIEKGYDRILILSYNRYMHYLLATDKSKPLRSKTKVDYGTFHSWAYKTLDYSYDYDKDDEARKNLINNARNSDLRYQAILVDEAQDFYDEWFQALIKVLDPQTNSLFFAYDNTQSIYVRTHRRTSDWTWKNLGIDVPGGRSQIFDINYRNSPEILELAWKFIKPYIAAADIEIAKKGTNPTIEKIIEPKKKAARSSGVSPLLIQSMRATMPAEIAQQVKTARQDHQDLRIGILLHPKAISSNNLLQDEIVHHLSIAGINPIAPETSQARRSAILHPGSVVIDSWNALKGMEFDAVIVAGVDYVLSSDNQDKDFKEKSGLYVAMTRAKDHLVMLYERETDVVNQIHQALNSENCLESDKLKTPDEFQVRDLGKVKNSSFLPEPLDVTIDSQKLLSCVGRFQQRKESFGINYTIKVLCGSHYLEEEHYGLSTYAIGKDKGEKFWENLYKFLLKNDLIELSYIQIAEGHRRPVLRLNSNSWEILKGNIFVIIKTESWKSLLIDSQKFQLDERGSYYTYSDSEELFADDHNYDISNNEEDFIMDTYDSFLADNDLDYGYLSDIENYDAY